MVPLGSPVDGDTTMQGTPPTVPSSTRMSSGAGGSAWCSDARVAAMTSGVGAVSGVRWPVAMICATSASCAVLGTPMSPFRAALVQRSFALPLRVALLHEGAGAFDRVLGVQDALPERLGEDLGLVQREVEALADRQPRAPDRERRVAVDELRELAGPRDELRRVGRPR